MPTAVTADKARSWLLVPASKPELFQSSAKSAADAIVLDLEDAVAPAAKPAARSAVVAWLNSGGRAWVRINDTTTDFWADDLEALFNAQGLEGVMLAKTESPDQVKETAIRMRPAPRIVALIESAAGLEAATEIARSNGTFRLAFGSGDFRRDTGMGDDPMAMTYPRARLTVASRIAQLPGAIDGPTLASDDSILATESRLTLSMGMTGKLCMRAEQATTVNRELAPSPSEVAWASETIAQLGDDGANVRDGSDLPRLAKAKKIARAAKLYDILANGQVCS